MIEQYKHILWDWNGTLLDDSWLCVEVLNDLLKEQGKDPISLKTYRNHFNFPVIHFYKYGNKNLERVLQLSSDFMIFS